MFFKIVYTKTARLKLSEFSCNPALSKKYKAVTKALALISQNIRHPGLNTHEISFLTRKYGFKVFESYAENNTPGAYRIFWRYGPGPGEIEILDITTHL